MIGASGSTPCAPSAGVLVITAGGGGGGGAGDDVDRAVVGAALVGALAEPATCDDDAPDCADAATELNAEVDDPAVQPAKAATNATPNGNQILRERRCMAHPQQSASHPQCPNPATESWDMCHVDPERHSSVITAGPQAGSVSSKAHPGRKECP